MVGMLLDEIVHNSTMSVSMGGGNRDGKVSAIGTSTKNTSPIVDNDGMDTLSMVVSMVGMTCFDVANPCGS